MYFVGIRLKKVRRCNSLIIDTTSRYRIPENLRTTQGEAFLFLAESPAAYTESATLKISRAQCCCRLQELHATKTCTGHERSAKTVANVAMHRKFCRSVSINALWSNWHGKGLRCVNSRVRVSPESAGLSFFNLFTITIMIPRAVQTREFEQKPMP